MMKSRIASFVFSEKDKVYELFPGFITSRAVLCGYYFSGWNTEKVKRDIKLLVDKALQEVEVKADSIDGVVAGPGWNSQYLTILARGYLETTSGGRDIKQICLPDQIGSLVEKGLYLIMVDHILNEDKTAGVVQLLREYKVNPLVLGALINRRRTNQTGIKGVSVVSLLDLSEYSADLEAGESLPLPYKDEDLIQSLRVM